MLRRAFVALCCVGVLCPIHFTALAGETLKPDFVLEPYASGLRLPTSMAFAPDGRLFIAEKGGAVRVVADGTLQTQPWAEIEVHTFLESGLLGLALDPNFEENGYVYLFATVSDQEQQILRLTDRDGVGVEQKTIRANIPTSGGLHNGGGLRVGPDSKLYFSVGDTDNQPAVQDLTSLAGKIGRINLDGSTPDDNPFTTPTGAPRTAIALGFRNPFRFAVTDDRRLIVLDVGSDDPLRREEINVVHWGDNCGWPLLEGSPAPGEHTEFVAPVFTYTELGAAPTGAIIYDGESYPAEYVGSFFHVDYVSNIVFRLVFDGDTLVLHEQFAIGEGGPVDLTVGLDGSIYYCEIVTGEVKRIRYSGAAPPGDDDDDPPVDDDDPAIGDTPIAPEPPRCVFGFAPLAALLAALVGGKRAIRRR